MLKRLLLALVAVAFATLAVEGALSLFAGRSLRDGGRARPAAPAPATDAERRAGAGGGYYAVHEDPFVRYTLRPDAELKFVDMPATTDASGQRKRPGPPPPEGAQRLVVLGDSVAFGYGVADDQTLAASLERVLAASRGPAARPLACFTVGAPSWNHRSAVHYLFDHWNELHPDVVVYVPVSNDLSDMNDVYETGAQRLAPDPSAPDPWLLASRSQLTSVELRLGEAWKDPQLGPVALEADLSPESSRRYDENAASIVALSDGLAARGARLLVVHSELYDYPWHLDARIRAQRPDLPLLYLERYVPDDFKLVGDPHPNASTVGLRALVVAQRLLELGFVDAGAGVPLPELSRAFRDLLSPPRDMDDIPGHAEKCRAEAAAKLRPAIDLRSGEGFRQVFGGLNLDGTVRLHLLALLAATGEVLRVQLAPLPSRPDLYPVDIEVDIDGAPAGRVTLRAGAPADVTLPLPAALARTGRPIEVRLRPAAWCVVQDRGRSETASCSLLRLDAGVRRD